MVPAVLPARDGSRPPASRRGSCVRIDTSIRVSYLRLMRAKRTYNLPERTVRAVRELAGTYGIAATQDGVIELAVDELARRLREEQEAGLWAQAATDPSFRAEANTIEDEYRVADLETWPRS